MGNRIWGTYMDNEIRNYRDLRVWQLAMELVVDCYRMAKSFPRHELFGLTSQLQRAAVSIPANIAEGHGRAYTKEYLRYIAIARGSLIELETHLLIAERLNYCDKLKLEELFEKAGSIGRMLTNLRRSLIKNT